MSLTRDLSGGFLTLLGLGIVMVELWQYWTVGHAIHPTPVLIGGSIALFGAYVLDPIVTRGGGNLILGFIQRGASIFVFWKTGKRKGDIAVTEIPAIPPKDDAA